MSLKDFLQGITRRRKPATGGLVRYDPDMPLIPRGGCGFAAPAEAAPDYTVTIRQRGYTEMTAEERQQLLDSLNQVMGREGLRGRPPAS